MIYSKQITSNSETTEYDIIYYNISTNQTLIKENIKTITYSVKNISSPTVEWDATSATINYIGVKITSYSKPDMNDKVEEFELSEEVTFSQNAPIDNPMDLSNPNTEYVDLGLPSGLKWAKCNIGAQTETESGAYFQWASTKGYATATDKDYSTQRTIEDSFQWHDVDVNYTVVQNGQENGFTWSNTPYYSGSSSNAYRTDAYPPATTLALTDDAAHVNMGGNWRMPTTAETIELKNNTQLTWYTEGNTEFNGIAGIKFTSKVDSTKYIFLPFGGSCNLTEVNYVGSNGWLWTSNLYSAKYCGYSIRGMSGGCNPQGGMNRKYGYNIRGVLTTD